MKISIIMPVYNVEKYLKKSIESVLKQSKKVFELICVDDGSTDQSLAILQRYAENFDEIKVYSKENEGSGYSRNYGLERASGNFIYFMDADDWVEQDFISDLEDYLSKYPDADLCLFGFNKIYQITKDSCVSDTAVNPHLLYLPDKKSFIKNYPKIYRRNSINSLWNKVYRKGFLKENSITFTNHRTCQDAYFNIKVTKHCESLLVIPKVYYNYIVNRRGSVTNIYNPKRIDEYIECNRESRNTLRSLGISTKVVDNYVWYFLTDEANYRRREKIYPSIRKKEFLFMKECKYKGIRTRLRVPKYYLYYYKERLFK